MPFSFDLFIPAIANGLAEEPVVKLAPSTFESNYAQVLFSANCTISNIFFLVLDLSRRFVCRLNGRGSSSY